jgi:hypothetical protein
MQTPPSAFGSTDFDVLEAAYAVIARSAAALLPPGRRAALRPIRLTASRPRRPAAGTAAMRQSHCSPDR